jgi:hypothetical protein
MTLQRQRQEKKEGMYKEAKEDANGILARSAEEKKIVGTVASNTCHFSLRPRKDETTKGGGTNTRTHNRANLTSNVIASAAKQSGNKKYIFAGIPDWLRRARYASVVFVAALAMTRFCCLCGISRLRTFHFQFSTFNFQFLKFI